MERISLKNPDLLGVAASLLCLIHCVLTPFLLLSSVLIVISPHGNEEEISLFWKALEMVFLILSFWSVRQATRQSLHAWIGYGLYIAWSILAITVILELVDVHFLGDYLKYIAVIVLIILHLYNNFTKHLLHKSR
ncbi:MerC mercury resistance protein [Algoriphagus alkaliphilus]|uniref:MerC mercury resistance protein n=1 Tax=Algoriphagus alkaliphilus TaxID=279824 RepID=A0A1G5ZQE2_9BACT|nr:MerC domain-containing protein [Algoriphagus alkaliphilus]MBA4300287.1 MerC domain-containing protein [Cyclobacterium sp.]SDA96696.1 MerC mercury resistance protein [Algoriphagus alkaliphilus]